MAIETVIEVISASSWVKVGDNVTSLTATENLVGSVRIYIVENGGPAPDGSKYQVWDAVYEYTGSAADVYMLSPLGSTPIGIVRE